MVDRTWIGGGNNQADNPNDWSPPGLPTMATDDPYAVLTFSKAVSAGQTVDMVSFSGVGPYPPPILNLNDPKHFSWNS